MTSNKTGTLTIGISTLLLFIVAFYGNQILPKFQEVFDGFKVDLPMSTSIVMSSYKAWWLLPIISIIFLVYSMRKKNMSNESHISRIKKIGIAGILLSVFISIFSVYAVYAPVLQ